MSSSPFAVSPKCPRCGEGKLYASLLRIVDHCASCGLDLKSHDAGDGPAFFAILIVGFLVTFAAGYVEFAYAPPMWLHAVLWLPFTLLACIYILRAAKAWLIALELKTNRMKDPS